MVRAWIMDTTNDDQREPHMTEPPQLVDLDELQKETKVEYFYFPPESVDVDTAYQGLKKDRGYTYEDVIEVSKDTLPNYEQKIKSFFEEHLHADEEIRYILGGSGYFDVRNKEDKWIRIEMNIGDLIVLPAGIYHRFTLDTNNYIKAKRLFVGEPVWTPINRPADNHPVRNSYIEALKSQV